MDSKVNGRIRCFETLIVNSAKEVMFLVGFVWLSAGLRKNYWPDFLEFQWKGVSFARVEPITF